MNFFDSTASVSFECGNGCAAEVVCRKSATPTRTFWKLMKFEKYIVVRIG